MDKHEGGCQCGGLRYAITGEPVMTALCHCGTCRRAHAAPAVAWAMYQAQQVEFTRGKPAEFESSPGAKRGFCKNCGTPITFTADYISGMIDIAIGSMDRPETVPPAFHYWESRRLPWLRLADDLQRHPEFPPVG